MAPESTHCPQCDSPLRFLRDEVNETLDYVYTYLDDGRIPIDNNHVENCIRPVDLGRKNWLLAGQRMAGIMSLLQTAKLNSIEPFTWLHFVLTHLPTWKNSQLDQLLPLPGNTFSSST
ncbi:transposase domain-containing protein [Serratia microhaemolytica]|uniref:transposase domain-containing protein n=1 Tax=Serratia microhaemolytica TaxID=2675110 RepID=UPI0023EA56DE|nr:transposase domain-containing protein [Serratia microhaemolytica]